MLRTLLAMCLLLVSDPSWRPVLPGYRFQFPRDHFEHEDFRTEWWYYTGNLSDAKGERYGFELVFFRQGVEKEPTSKSVWVVRDVYLAHTALTHGSFAYSERLNRSGPGVAGASGALQRVWNGNWQVNWSGEKQTLDAITDKFRFHLELDPVKPPVVHGVEGVSAAAHYVSFPRLRARGTVNSTPVTGQAWFDHEWFTSLKVDSGWDWFSAQLDDNTELMLYSLHRLRAEGTYIDAEGKAHHLTQRDFTLEPVEKWGSYPVVWRIRVPSLRLDLECRALIRDQLLRGKPTYWEGAVNYSGSRRGVGYLEMTGYEK